MTSSWLASFVLIVVFLGIMAIISGGVWVAFLFLSRWDRRGWLGRERDPAEPRAVVGQRVLDLGGTGRGMALLLLLVKEVAPADQRRGLVADGRQACVWAPCPRSSGAPAPPILVGTQPGFTAFDSTSGHRRPTAMASARSNSLLSL